MDFLDKVVIHRAFGEGVVCRHDQSRFEVRFGEEIKLFSFPTAFNSFLRFADETDQQIVEQMIREKDAKEEKERLSWLNNYTAPTSRPGAHEKKPTRKIERPNIVFKCNFCDGGSGKDHIGYMGACSDAIIRYNIEIAKHSWCSDPECPCNQYYYGEIDGRTLDQIFRDGGFTCYESKMLKEWTAAAGTYLTKDRKMEPKKMRNVQPNSLAVLTTRLPNYQEEDRIIFGVFLVDDATEGDQENEGSVSSNSKYRIELAPEEAKQLKLWNYHANNEKPQKAVWGQGLYRYINDIEAVQILRDVVAVKRAAAEKILAEEFLEHFCKIKKINLNDVPDPFGALKR